MQILALFQGPAKFLFLQYACSDFPAHIMHPSCIYSFQKFTS